MPNDPAFIGQYRLTARLGEGGMGQVYLGESVSGRRVAVKVVRAHLAADPGFRQRFRREIEAARTVGGFWTAPVVDADPEAATPWVASAYIEAPDLGQLVAEDGPLAEAELRALAAGLAEALDAIHRAGLVHRDLKPSNVLVTGDGPRVIDFGISKALEGGTTLTGTGLVVGTPGFMSPEQATGAEVGPPSDIFSLGAVLAFAATGEGPFGVGSAPALLYRVVHDVPRLDGVPGVLREMVARCLEKRAERRPSAGELLQLSAGAVGAAGAAGAARGRQAGGFATRVLPPPDPDPEADTDPEAETDLDPDPDPETDTGAGGGDAEAGGADPVPDEPVTPPPGAGKAASVRARAGRGVGGWLLLIVGLCLLAAGTVGSVVMDSPMDTVLGVLSICVFLPLVVLGARDGPYDTFVQADADGLAIERGGIRWRADWARVETVAVTPTGGAGRAWTLVAVVTGPAAASLPSAFGRFAGGGNVRLPLYFPNAYSARVPLLHLHGALEHWAGEAYTPDPSLLRS
ncbi:serine/threonine-protein kinase [Streptomyces sp. NPDC057271]|uniref:serine/threonine-protein kinase n=1 Tax=unclassified Streptomyces TaxID=2593676 RepID=UPI003641E41D